MNAGLDLSEGNERDESMRQNVLLGTSKIFPFACTVAFAQSSAPRVLFSPLFLQECLTTLMLWNGVSLGRPEVALGARLSQSGRVRQRVGLRA